MAFIDDGKLRDVHVSDLIAGVYYDVPRRVTKIGSSAFSLCRDKVISISIPDSVVQIESSAFSRCTSLTAITIPNSIKRNEKHTFFGCTSLEKIVIPESVRTIEDEAFLGCSFSLILLPKTIQSFSPDAFMGLESKDITFFVEENSAAHAFVKKQGYRYEVLKQVPGLLLRDTVYSYPSGAFKGSDIRSIPILERVTEIEAYAFADCEKLESIHLPKNLVSIKTGAFSVKNPTGKVKLLVIPPNVKRIERDAFAGRQLEEITFNDNIKTIEVGAFSDVRIPIVSLPKTATDISPDAFNKDTIVLIDSEDSELINLKKRNADDLNDLKKSNDASEHEEKRKIGLKINAILNLAAEPSFSQLKSDLSVDSMKIKEEFKARIENATVLLKKLSADLIAAENEAAETESCSEAFVSAMRSEEIALQKEIEDINNQLKSTFFLNLSKKRELRSLLESKINEEKELLEKISTTIQNVKSDKEKHVQEIAIIRRKIYVQKETCKRLSNALTGTEMETLERLETEYKQNQEVRAEKLASLEKEIHEKESKAEKIAKEKRLKAAEAEQNKQFLLEKEIHKKKVLFEKETLEKKFTSYKPSVIKNFSSSKKNCNPDEALLNDAYNMLVSDARREQLSKANQQYLKENKKSIDRIIELNQKLRLEDYDGIEAIKDLEVSFVKPDIARLPVRITALIKLFSANPKWTEFKKTINSRKLTLAKAFSAGDLHKEFFQGQDLAVLKDEKGIKLLFLPFCFLVVSRDGMKQFFYNKELVFVKTREFESQTEDTRYELVGNRYTYINKDGSKNMRFSVNPLLYQLRESFITIKAGEKEYLVREETKEQAEEFVSVYKDFLASLNEEPFTSAYKAVIAFSDVETVEQCIEKGQQAQKEKQKKEKEAFLLEQKKREAEQAQKEQLATERRKELIRKQQERNTEIRFDNIPQDMATALEVEKQEYVRKSEKTPLQTPDTSALPGFENALRRLEENGEPSSENGLILVSRSRKIFNNIFSLDFMLEEPSSEGYETNRQELMITDSAGKPISNRTAVDSLGTGKCKVLFTLNKARFGQKDRCYLILVDKTSDKVTIMAEFSINIAFGNDFNDDFGDVLDTPSTGLSNNTKEEETSTAANNQMPVGRSVEKISDSVLYLPGEEPEKIWEQLNRLFEKLDAVYPDKAIVGLHKDHKNLGETVTRLYRQLGYPDNESFLKAYGYTVRTGVGGRTSANPMNIIEELKRRYANGPTCSKLPELIAENPDLASKFKNIQNQADKLFGMTFSRYLVQEGILLDIREEHNDLEILKGRYANNPYSGSLNDLSEENKDLNWYFIKKSCAESGTGKTLKEFLIQEGVMKREEKPVRKKEPVTKRKIYSTEEKEAILNEIMQYGIKNKQLSLSDLLAHFPGYSQGLLRSWAKEIHGTGLYDYYLQGGALIDFEKYKEPLSHDENLEKEISTKEKIMNLYDNLDAVDIAALAKKAGVSLEGKAFPTGHVYTVERGGITFSVKVRLKATFSRISLEMSGFDAKKPLGDLMTRDELLMKYDPKLSSIGRWTGPLEYREGYPKDKELTKRRILFLKAIGALLSSQEMVEAIVDYAPKKKDGTFKKNQHVRIANAMLGSYPGYFYEILGRIKNDTTMDIAYEESNVTENTLDKACQDFLSSHWNLFQ